MEGEIVSDLLADFGYKVLDSKDPLLHMAGTVAEPYQKEGRYFIKVTQQIHLEGFVYRRVFSLPCPTEVEPLLYEHYITSQRIA